MYLSSQYNNNVKNHPQYLSSEAWKGNLFDNVMALPLPVQHYFVLCKLKRGQYYDIIVHIKNV